jgi:hypothetical protein
MKTKVTIALISAFMMGCIDPFQPEVRRSDNLYVVEGLITNEVGPYYVEISKSIRYGGNIEGRERVSNASVEIFDDSDNCYPMEEIIKGRYATVDQGFIGEPGKEYFLRIITQEGIQIISTPEKMPTPVDITEINLRLIQKQFINNSGNISFDYFVEFLIDITLENSSSRFFKYDWEGTYKTIPPFNGIYIDCPNFNPEFDPNFTPIDPSAFCYVTDKAEKFINVLSTESITEGIYFNHIITQINPNIKFEWRYSLLVKQLSITKSAYSFYNAIESQQNNVGGLFDSPPTRIKGNLRIEGAEKNEVLGYFMVASVSSKRAFFNNSDLNKGFTHYETCDCYPTRTECLSDPNFPPDPVSNYCCDCRLLENSTTNIPDFWID